MNVKEINGLEDHLINSAAAPAERVEATTGGELNADTIAQFQELGLSAP